MRIGIHQHEKDAEQPVLVNIELSIPYNSQWRDDAYEQTLCYDSIIQSVKEMTQKNHIHLVETLAEQIAVLCLKDSRVISVRVGVHKTTVYGDGTKVGVEIVRQQSTSVLKAS